MCTTGIRERAGGGLAAWLLAATVVQGAEIVGVVQPRQPGPAQEASAGMEQDISVSLQPLEGQPLPPQGAAQRHRIRIRDGRLQPAFITLRTGDTLELVNQDEVHHELFALSPSQPLELSLDKASSGAAAQAEVRLVSEGVWHLFCRIHSRSYARVDAVATPLFQMVESGETFRFEGLLPGSWQLRVAAAGAETRLIKAAAITAPPPLRIELARQAGTAPAPGQAAPPAGSIEALFPRD